MNFGNTLFPLPPDLRVFAFAVAAAFMLSQADIGFLIVLGDDEFVFLGQPAIGPVCRGRIQIGQSGQVF